MKLDRGFTLVEMLVVVAIIATLAAILFPVITHAKNVVFSTTCASNLRQIGMGAVLYAGDYDDRFPVAPSPYLRKEILDGSVSFGEPLDSQIASSPTLVEVLEPYGCTPLLFRCPKDWYPSPVTGLTSGRTYYEVTGASYAADTGWLLSKSQSSYEDPSGQGMLGEVIAFHSEPHPKAKTVIAFADTRAKSLTWETRLLILDTWSAPAP